MTPPWLAVLLGIGPRHTGPIGRCLLVAWTLGRWARTSCLERANHQCGQDGSFGCDSTTQNQSRWLTLRSLDSYTLAQVTQIVIIEGLCENSIEKSQFCSSFYTFFILPPSLFPETIFYRTQVLIQRHFLVSKLWFYNLYVLYVKLLITNWSNIVVMNLYPLIIKLLSTLFVFLATSKASNKSQSCGHKPIHLNTAMQIRL